MQNLKMMFKNSSLTLLFSILLTIVSATPAPVPEPKGVSAQQNQGNDGNAAVLVPAIVIPVVAIGAITFGLLSLAAQQKLEAAEKIQQVASAIANGTPLPLPSGITIPTKLPPGITLPTAIPPGVLPPGVKIPPGLLPTAAPKPAATPAVAAKVESGDVKLPVSIAVGALALGAGLLM
ncbi:hypothetical protein HDV02_004347 [Globomyces sp. JEL0801]|nr:hypothetical protein HDV02_004347 [Globomyces sp. JEL0801]